MKTNVSMVMMVMALMLAVVVVCAPVQHVHATTGHLYMYNSLADCSSNGATLLSLDFTAIGQCLNQGSPNGVYRSSMPAVCQRTSKGSALDVAVGFFRSPGCADTNTTTQDILAIPNVDSACFSWQASNFANTSSTGLYYFNVMCDGYTPGTGGSGSKTDPAIVFGAVFGTLMLIALIVASIWSYRLSQRPEFAHLK